MVLAGLTLCEPLVSSVPLQPPLALQLAAWVELQVSVADPPAVIEALSAVSVTLGLVTALIADEVPTTFALLHAVARAAAQR